MKDYTIVFSKEFKNEFAEQIELIETIVEKEFDLLLQIHPETGIEIEFNTMYAENPYLRFSAAADEPRKMWIKINSFIPNRKEMLPKHLPQTICHEFHHMIRWKYVSEFNLAEQLIMEGLAEHFVIELKQSDPPPYIRKVESKTITDLLPLIINDLFNKGFQHRKWQKGDTDLGIPANFVYSYGYHLVAEYLNQNPNAKPSNLFGINCLELLPAELINNINRLRN